MSSSESVPKQKVEDDFMNLHLVYFKTMHFRLVNTAHMIHRKMSILTNTIMFRDF